MNSVPAWIQAGAALVQALAAVTIYYVTKEYVRLTKGIASAASDQLEFTRLNQLAEDKLRAGGLRGRASSLESRLNALPEEVDDTAFRQRALWTFEEIDALQQSSALVNGLSADAASSAAIELTWILDRLQAIRAVPIPVGYDYPRFFPHREWRERRGTGLMQLRALMRLAQAAAEWADQEARQLSKTRFQVPNQS